jgi:predicted PurR-regulated permease PerM
MAIELSQRQQQAAATAVTVLSVVVILAALGGFFWLVARFLRHFTHVFLPLAVAGIAALVCQPYYDWLREKLKLPAPVAIVALIFSVVIPLSAFLVFFGVVLAEQVGELVEKFPVWWKQFMEQAKERWPQFIRFLEQDPLGQKIRAIAEGQAGALAEGLQYFGVKAWSAGAGVVRGVGAAAAWVVTPVYFVFFLMAGRKEPKKLEEYLPFLKPETRKDVVFLADEFVNIMVAFFRGQLVIAFLQGVLFAIGFSIVGLKFGLILGLLLGFLNIIPYLGSIVGLGVCLPLAYFQEGGGLGVLIGVVVVFVIVQLIEGYLLTPKIMGDRTGLHPVAIIVAVFFWGSALGGILGMILAIPLTAFLVVFWRLAREKYIQEWV